MLYPLTAGGVALDWRLPSALVEPALRAFAAHRPVAMLYLRHLDASGDTVAKAELDQQQAWQGSGRFERPLTGVLQAELGLEGRRDGAWLLLARSNRLATVPRAAMIPSASAGNALAARSGQESVLEPEMPAQPAAPPALASPAAALAVLPPEPAAASSPLLSRFPDPSLVTEATGPLAHGRVFPIPVGAGLMAGGRQPISNELAQRMMPTAAGRLGLAPLASRWQTAPESPRIGEGPAALAHERLGSEVGMDLRAPNRQDSTQPAPSLVSGSGPIKPYPTLEGASIRGQLHVFGGAPPGSLLDLGGHPYRVGPGGRFAFTVDLDDPKLLALLLSLLPGLPVAERDS